MREKKVALILRQLLITHVKHEMESHGFVKGLQDFVCVSISSLRLRPVRDDMLVENDGTNFTRPVGMQCW
jgi:hypothetical protein